MWILYNDDLVKKRTDIESGSGFLRDWWLHLWETQRIFHSLSIFIICTLLCLSRDPFPILFLIGSLVFSPFLFLILFLTEVGFGFLRDWSSGPRERVFLSRSISGGQPSLHYSSLVLSSEVIVPLIVMPRRTDFAF